MKKIDGRKCNSSKNGIILSNFKWQGECKKPITHCVYKKYYAWNPIVRACECCKNLNTSGNCTCIKSVPDNLVIPLNEITDTLETVTINFIEKSVTDKANFWLICAFLLESMQLILLIIIAVNCYYCKKYRSITECLVSY